MNIVVHRRVHLITGTRQSGRTTKAVSLAAEKRVLTNAKPRLDDKMTNNCVQWFNRAYVNYFQTPETLFMGGAHEILGRVKGSSKVNMIVSDGPFDYLMYGEGTRKPILILERLDELFEMTDELVITVLSSDLVTNNTILVHALANDIEVVRYRQTLDGYVK